jgi:hypothetical protein
MESKSPLCGMYIGIDAGWRSSSASTINTDIHSIDVRYEAGGIEVHSLEILNQFHRSGGGIVAVKTNSRSGSF